ncbi:MAG: hypothetical protein PHN75_03695 [Syntrophales bacterium]|nr:hypothetical protein [Syntrophales bacterium]
MKDMRSIIAIINSGTNKDIMKSATLLTEDNYLKGISEAYGNLQDGEPFQDDSAISYFRGNA